MEKVVAIARPEDYPQIEYAKWVVQNHGYKARLYYSVWYYLIVTMPKPKVIPPLDVTFSELKEEIFFYKRGKAVKIREFTRGEKVYNAYSLESNVLIKIDPNEKCRRDNVLSNSSPLLATVCL